MSEQTMAHLFEPFFTTKSVGKGTGLGLATVYGIVKQNDGFITVESQLGRGSIFRVYLPPTHIVPSVETSPDSAASATVPRSSILLVEDEERLRELLRRHLSARGYAIVTACDGNEGLAICQDGAYMPDLLLTDVVMPGMSGRELAERLRATCPSLKVLFITGYTDEKLVRQGSLPSGMACLNKPFELRVLEQKIRETLETR
jgi:CheY-like chemotaxis protein